MTPEINRRDLLASTSVLAGLGLAGCTRVVDEARRRLTCREMGLTETSARPGETLTIDGVVEEFGEDPVAWVSDPDSSDEGRYPVLSERTDGDRYPVLLERTGEEQADVVVPAHPDDWQSGGRLELTIESEDGDVSCSGFEMTVEPLAPAPGTLEEALEEVETGFREVARTLEYDPDQLLEADVTELDLPVNGIAAGLQVVAGAEYPNNLRAVLAGEAPILEEFADDDLDAGVRHPGPSVAGGSLDQSIGAPRRAAGPPEATLAAGELGDADADGLVDALAEEHDLLDQLAAMISGLADVAEEFTTFQLGEEEMSPTALHNLMIVQDIASQFAEGASEDLREFAEVAAGATSTTVAATGVGLPLAAQLGVAGNLIACLGIAIRAIEGKYPSNLELEIEADPESYDEDLQSGNVPGTWSAEVEATSEGFTVEWTDSVTAIPVAGPSLKFLSRVGNIGTDAARTVLSMFENSLKDIWGVSGEDSGPVRFDPKTFRVEGGVTPSREDEDEYFIWELETIHREGDTDPIVFVDEDETREYEPKAVGVSELRVRTRPDKFRGAASGDIERISVDPIDVTIQNPDTGGSYSIVRLDLDYEATVDLWAEVEHATDKHVEWSIETDEGPDPPDLSWSGEFDQAATVDASGLDFSEEEQKRGIYYVKAESTTDDGLREDSPRERSDHVWIIVSDEDPELVVSPVECVSTGQPYQFTVLLDGHRVSFENLNWTVSGQGSINEDGVFFSDTEGNVSVEFAYETAGGRSITEEVDFEVTDYCSYLTITTSRFTHTSNCVVVREDEPGAYIETSHEEEISVKIFAPALRPNEDPLLEGEWVEEHGWDGAKHTYTWAIDVYGEYDSEAYPRSRGGSSDADRPSLSEEQMRDRRYNWHSRLPGGGHPPSDVHRGTLTVERRERKINGETVGVYSGSFAELLRYYDTVGGEWLYTEVYGEFAGAIPHEYRSCFDDDVPLRSP